jgi:glycosyltransferase involved in cell wall biosynthesis
MDVAVFPNRGEGGTNLVAMECMACGVPTILSANTGHLDIADPNCCFPLLTQGPVSPGGQSGPAIEGWGESSVNEIVEHLERVHSDRKEAARRGAAAASRLADLTWRHTAQALKRVVLDIPSQA